MVLLLLLALWGALLVSWLRSRSTGTFSDSVGTFRRHLGVLERATPSVVTPANRLYGQRSGRGRAGAGAAAARVSQMASSTHVAGASQRAGFSSRAAVSPAGRRLSPPVAASGSALRRRQARKRRRDVFFALIAGALGSLALALIPGLGVMWAVQAVFDILLVGYCAVLVRLRNAAAERELKLAYMPSARPGRRLAPTYDFGAGYGELELRRAAT